MKKFTAILLAVVMVFALGASAFAADTTPVTTKAVDTTLSVTVDYTIEGLYFDGTTLKSSVMRGRALYRNHMGITAGPGKVLRFQRLGETIYPAIRSACR